MTLWEEIMTDPRYHAFIIARDSHVRPWSVGIERNGLRRRKLYRTKVFAKLGYWRAKREADYLNCSVLAPKSLKTNPFT